MPTHLYYGNPQLKLQNVQTLQFSQEPMRERSNTDQLYYRYRIKVRCLINADLLANYVATAQGVFPANDSQGSSSPFNGMTTQQAEVLVGQILGQDRQNFSYVMENAIVLQSSSATDCENGPKVTSLEITRFTPATLRIDFGIEVALVTCPNFTPWSPSANPDGSVNPGQASPSGPQFPVIANRWSCIDDYDENFMCTRTWEGVLRISNSQGSISSANGSQQVQLTPQMFRALCVPPLIQGWKRIGMQFIGEPDNLTLGYRITDRQMSGPAPPWPATKMHITHGETVGVGDSGKGAAVTYGIGQCTVSMAAGRMADKRILLERAVQILEVKLAMTATNVKALTSYAVLELAVVDHQGDDTNSIEVSAKVAHVPPSGTSTSAAPNAQVDQYLGSCVMLAMGVPLQLTPADPGTNEIDSSPTGNAQNTSQAASDPNVLTYNPDQSFMVGPYGSATVASLYACFLQSPCGQNHAMPQTATSSTSPAQANASYGQVTSTGGTQSQGYPDTPNTTYSTGAVSATMGTAPGYSASQQANIYTFCQIESILIRDHHRVFLPIAGQVDSGNDTISAFKLAPTTARRIIRMHAERYGDWPVFARAQTFVDGNGITNYIDTDEVLLASPPVSSDPNKQLFKKEVEYRFVLSRPPKSTEALRIGGMDWLDQTKMNPPPSGAGAGSSSGDGAVSSNYLGCPASTWTDPTDSSTGIA